MTPEEARESVRYTINVCAKDGGFIPTLDWDISNQEVLEAIKNEIVKCEADSAV